MTTLPLLSRQERPSIVAWAVLQALYTFLYVWHLVVFAYHQVIYAAARATRYHHRSPQLIRDDVESLKKIPRHIAVILGSTAADDTTVPLDELYTQVGDVACWCIGAGSPQLTIFEREGRLNVDIVRKAVSQRLRVYFANAPLVVVLSPTEVDNLEYPESGETESPALRINILSLKDGRDAIVDLARDYAVQAQAGVLEPQSLTLESVGTDLNKRVGGEPDLLVTFSSRLDLRGVSPWHIRVTELFCLPDNEGVVSYHVFLKALRKFSGVKINLGS